MSKAYSPHIIVSMRVNRELFSSSRLYRFCHRTLHSRSWALIICRAFVLLSSDILIESHGLIDQRGYYRGGHISGDRVGGDRG